MMLNAECQVSNFECRMSNVECWVFGVKLKESNNYDIQKSKIENQKSRIKKVSDATYISDGVFYMEGMM